MKQTLREDAKAIDTEPEKPCVEVLTSSVNPPYGRALLMYTSVFEPDKSDSGSGNSDVNCPLKDAPEAARHVAELYQSYGFEVEIHRECQKASDFSARVANLTEIRGEKPSIVHVITHGISNTADTLRVRGYSSSPKDQSGFVGGWIDSFREQENYCAAPVLFVIDTCNAGAAIRLPGGHHIASSESGAWVMAACQADKPAYNAQLTKALTAALEDPEQMMTGFCSAKFVPWVALTTAVKHALDEQLTDSASLQIPEFTAVQTSLSPQLFLNKAASNSQDRYLDEMPDSVREFSAYMDVPHFEDRVMANAPVGSAPHFVGRKAAMRQVNKWLRMMDGASSDVLIVTGGRGAGKSALLGGFAFACHSQLAMSHSKLHGPEGVGVMAKPFKDWAFAVVHLRNKDEDFLLKAMTEQLGLDIEGELSVDSVTAALGPRSFTGEPPVVLVDALDEAVTIPQCISVLQTLVATNQNGKTLVRFLVGVRWNDNNTLIDTFVKNNGHQRIDLEDPKFDLTCDDLTTYVNRISHYDLGSDTDCLIDDLELAEAVADRIMAYRSARSIPGTFSDSSVDSRWGKPLMASLIARHIQRHPPLGCGCVEEYMARLPTEPESLLRAEIEALPIDSQSLMRYVVACLAWSKGEGVSLDSLTRMMPEQLLGGRASDRSSQLKVSKALDHLKFYVRSMTLPGDPRLRYRLFHEAISEAWRAEPLPDTNTPPPAVLWSNLLASKSFRWDDADPYLQTYGLAHAIDAGAHEELICNVDFLLVADPTTTIAAMAPLTFESESARNWAHIYRCAASEVGALGIVPQVMTLAVAAARAGYKQQLNELNDSSVGLIKPIWGTGAQLPSPAQRFNLTGHTNALVNVCTSTLRDGTSVAITISEDSTARVWNLVTGKQEHTLTGHENPLTSVATATLRDGTSAVITTSKDSTARVWDLNTGQLLHTLGSQETSGTRDLSVDSDELLRVEFSNTGHNCRVTSVATTLSRDGTALAITTSWDCTARVWDVNTGECWGTFTRHNTPVTGVVAAALNDGTPVVVTTSDDGVAHVWDVPSCEHRYVLEGHAQCVTGVVITLVDGAPVAISAGQDNTACVWHLDTGRIRNVLQGHSSSVTGVAAATLSDGTPVVVTTSKDGTARVWDLNTNQHRHGLEGGALWVTGITTTLLDATPLIIVTTDDNTVRVWDLDTGQMRDAFEGHSSSVTGVAAAALRDGTPAVVTTSEDGTARVWDLTTGEAFHPLTGHDGLVTDVATTMVDGAPVAVTASQDNTACVWNLKTGRMRHRLEGHTQYVTGVVTALVDGAPVAVTASQDNTARVWDLKTGQHLKNLTGHRKDVTNLIGVTLRGRTPAAIAFSYDKTARVWDLNTDRIHSMLIGHTKSHTSAAAATLADGSTVAITTSGDETARVWDLENGEVLRTFTARGVTGVATSVRGGRTVGITTSYDCTARVWDLENGEFLAVVHLGIAVSHIAIDPTSMHLVAATGDDIVVFDIRGVLP